MTHKFSSSTNCFHFCSSWDSRSCLQEKHYICQTNLKTVTSKGRKKLQKVYSTNKYKKLNEVPVPIIYDDTQGNEIDQNTTSFLKNAKLQPENFYEVGVINHAAFAKRTKEERIRRKKEKEERRKEKEERRRERENRRREREMRKKRKLESRWKRKHDKRVNSTVDGENWQDKKWREERLKAERKKKNGKERSHHNYNIQGDKAVESPLYPKKIIEDFSNFNFDQV